MSSNTTTSRKAFTPPLFGQFGKKAKDLFKKKYDFDNSAKIINKTAQGIKIESTVVAGSNAQLRGVFKTEAPIRTLGRLNGTFETEFHTVSNLPSTTSYKLNKLYDNLSVKLGLTGVKADPKQGADFPEGWASADVEYSQEYVAAAVGVRSDSKTTLLDVALSAGFDNLSVGGKLVFNKDAADNSKKFDTNFGAQVDGPDYVLAGVTDKNHQQVNISYFQSVSRGQSVGAILTAHLAKGTRTLTFGTDYEVDVDTSVRAYAKVDSANRESTTLATAVEHRLLNPQLLLGVAAEFNATTVNIAPAKLGVSLTFGDF